MDPQHIAQRLDKAISELQELRTLVLADAKPMEAAFPAEALAKVNARICLICGRTIAKKQKRVRACHEACNRAVLDKIKLGVFTDTEAVARGLLTPPKKGGRPMRKDTALAEAVAEKQSTYDADESFESEHDTVAKEIRAAAAKSAKKKSNR